MAYGIVMKPIPGTGYGIGEPAIFSKEQEEKYADYLAEGSYLKTVTKAEYDKLVKNDEPADEEVIEAARTRTDENTVQLTKEQYQNLLNELEAAKTSKKEDDDEARKKVTDGETKKAASGEKR